MDIGQEQSDTRNPVYANLLPFLHYEIRSREVKFRWTKYPTCRGAALGMTLT